METKGTILYKCNLAIIILDMGTATRTYAGGFERVLAEDLLR